MNKLLITGVNGFIGQALTAALHDEYEIFGCYEHASGGPKNPELDADHRLVMDLQKPRDVLRVTWAVQPDYVIHLAARSEVANSFDNYHEVGQINYGGTVTLAESLRKNVPDLKLFVMASTMETYGIISPMRPVDEKTVQRPMAPYAVAKKASELYLEYMGYAYDFPFTTLRQTNSYGRHDNDFFVMERIITQMLAGDMVDLGDPTPIRNFLYIDDLVGLYRTVLDRYAIARGETFVTGPDNALSIGALVDLIAKELDWKGLVNWHTIPPRPGEIFYLNSDPRYALSQLGWSPTTSLSEGIRKTAEMWGK